MNATDQATIRTDFLATISAISPSHDEYQDQKWRAVNSIADVAGGDVRGFFLRILPSNSNGAGIYGHGIGRSAECRIYTNYSGLADAESSIIDEDYLQLYHALEARLDPTLAGLCWVAMRDGFVFEDDTPGHVWGYHAFDIEYIWRHTLDP